MTVEELMKPRYKVVADFPENKWKVGQILFFDEMNSVAEWESGVRFIDLSVYPAIFKQLEWWEERKPEEMPKYVKFPVPIPDMIKVIEVAKFSRSVDGDCIAVQESGLAYKIWDECTPATEVEYLEYLEYLTYKSTQP